MRSAGKLPQLCFEVIKVYWLGKKLCCATLRRLPPSLVITVSGHDHYWQLGEPLLDLAEQLPSGHAGHVDVGESRDRPRLDFTRDPIQRFIPRRGIVQDIRALAGLATKPLPKELGHVGLVVD